MLTTLIWLLAALVAPLLIPLAVLIVEVLAACLPARRHSRATGSRPRCTVLIPAHNEEGGIGITLAAIRPQLAPGDRILVVADNCTDGTAAVARAAGAEVVERYNPARRGKGYALDCGVRALEGDAPDVVVIVDADCLLERGALDHLAYQAAATGRPAQAAYLMEAPVAGGTRARLAAFAFTLKNVVRPRGLARFGLPCLLTGSGMAFPWPLLRDARLASGNLVEDMQLGIDLALAGRPPLFCPEACVRSELPIARAAATQQRTRWVHGHLQTMGAAAPRLLAAAARLRRADLAGLAFELGVPPLSLLGLLVLAAVVALSFGWLVGGPGRPAVVAVCAGGACAVALLLAWARFGRRVLSLGHLLAAPLEFAQRLPILLRFVVRPQAAWVRTARGSAGAP